MGTFTIRVLKNPDQPAKFSSFSSQRPGRIWGLCPLVLILIFCGMFGCQRSDTTEYRELDAETLLVEEAGSGSSPAKNSAAEPSIMENNSNRPDEPSGSEAEAVFQAGKTEALSSTVIPETPETLPAPATPAEASPALAGAQTPQEMAVIANKIASGETQPTQPAGGTAGALPGDPTAPLEPRIPKLLIPEKTFREEGPEQAFRVTFDDIDLLKVLNMEPVPEDAVEMFPDWLRNLDGKRVLIRGFMFPTLTQTGITYFQHVRDNEICCFGRTPKVYDRISTILKPGKPANYIQGRPFDVLGTLRIDPVYDEGEWLQLYLLEDAVVIDR